ncbi:MAG TPA: EAL domain-containing protein [Pseudomonadales bacterium]|nr:EAL domain-containing protein [Pseudomonadales bacterium]
MLLSQEHKRFCLDNLAIHYQTVVNGQGEVLKYELLSRLPESSGIDSLESFFGDLTPEESIEVAFKQIERSRDIFNATGLVCSINVDNIVLVEDSLKKRLLNACASHDHPLILEFTEIRPMPPAEEINALFFALKKQGISIALDDFGTGFNGMSIFADYDFDIIKIDRSLITGIQTRPQKLYILSHMLDLMNALEKQHIVEGVESMAQFEQLRDIGFDAFQGFLFHRPGPVEELL